MLQEKIFKDIILIVLLVVLIVAAILVVKPIFLALVLGSLLAYIFTPLYKKSKKLIKNPTASALIICLGLLIILLAAVYFLVSPFINQAMDFYLSMQGVNLGEKIASVLSNIISKELSLTIANSLNNIISHLLTSFLTSVSGLALKLPGIFLQILVTIFIFFFALRDGEKAICYLKSISPLSKEVHDRFLKNFKEITSSILLGQVIVGIIQGLVTGIGLFVFRVPNAFVLTFLSIIAGVLPLIGSWIVWVPTSIALIVSGNTNSGVGLAIFGILIVAWIDNILRPIIVSRRTSINPAIVLIGMIGGLFAFGFIGLILGPLILSYVILIIELYKEKKAESILIKEEPKT